MTKLNRDVKNRLKDLEATGHNYATISGMLNDENHFTREGRPFTAQAVSYYLRSMNVRRHRKPRPTPNTSVKKSVPNERLNILQSILECDGLTDETKAEVAVALFAKQKNQAANSNATA